MTPEKKVQNTIIDYLKKLESHGEPVYYERRQAGGLSYKAGLPDIFFVYNGIHVEVEIKKPGGKRSELQVKMAKRLVNKYKILYVLADTVEDIKPIIQNIKNLFKGGISTWDDVQKM